MQLLYCRLYSRRWCCTVVNIVMLKYIGSWYTRGYSPSHWEHYEYSIRGWRGWRNKNSSGFCPKTMQSTSSEGKTPSIAHSTAHIQTWPTDPWLLQRCSSSSRHSCLELYFVLSWNRTIIYALLTDTHRLCDGFIIGRRWSRDNSRSLSLLKILGFYQYYQYVR